MPASDWNRATIEKFHAQRGLGIPPWGDHLLLLTTVGAKSGKPSVTPVVYIRDGDRYAVMASMGGAPRNPNWYHNLVSNPVVGVEVKTDTFQARASVAQGAERERLFKLLGEVWPGFYDYEKKTKRVMPVVVLEPIAA